MSHADPSLRPELWIEHREFVRALARRLLADEHAAEDVAQEACIAALESPPKSNEAARAWLTRVVRNLSFNVLREKERRARREKTVAREEASEPDVDARIETQRRVLEAVTALREPYKTTIWMRWFEGLPPREIARRLDLPVETVKSRLKRGLAELQLALDREFGDRERWLSALAPLALFERPFVGPSGWPIAGAACFTIVAIWGITAGTSPSARPALRPEFAGIAAEEARAAPLLAIERASHASTRVVASVADRSTGSVIDANARGAAPMTAVEQANGPRFELEFEPPSGLERDDFDCWLDLDGVAADWRERQVAPVDSAPLPEVRFARTPRTSLLGGGARTTYALTLASHDGLWRATQHIPATTATEPRRVKFELGRRAVVTGFVRDREGSARGGVRIRLRDAHGALVAEESTSNAGGFEAAGLVPGRYELDARSMSFAETTTSFDVDQLERKVLQLTLAARATTPLEGRLSSRTGQHVPRGVVRLVSVEDPLITLTTNAIRDPASSAGEFVFRFDAVAPGTYEIVPPMDDAFAWNPPFASVTTPCRMITLTCRDDALVNDVALRAVESDTGRPIEHVRAMILLDRYDFGRKHALALEPRVLQGETRAGEVVFEDIPVGMSGWWLVEADGRRSAWGELNALSRRAGRLETETRLDGAWTAHMWIGTRDELGQVRALAGARVVTRGGDCLARSLESGDALIDLLFDPGRIHVELPGWRVANMEGFVNGKLRQQLDVHRVWMSRE